jgi:hypothetical protein
MLSPYPEHTKQTKCNNNLNLERQQDIFRPMISNTSIPLRYNHEHYTLDNNTALYQNFDLERSSISSRNDCMNNKNPVQSNFQNNYYTMTFDDLNHQNNQEINKYLSRNPVNSRRDTLEKVRNEDRQDFMRSQGGILSNFTDLKIENTRKDKNTINSSNYIPMPRTMAIPKEKI